MASSSPPTEPAYAPLQQDGAVSDDNGRHFKPLGIRRPAPPPPNKHGHGDKGGSVPLLLEEGSTTMTTGGREEEEGEGDGPLLPSEPSVSAMMNQASMWSCVAVLANNMMGAGTLGLPYGVAQTGWLGGAVLLVASCAMSAHGLHLLTLAARTANQHSSSNNKAPPSGTAMPAASFQSLCLAALPRWVFLVDAAIAIKCFGVAVSYLVIVGDLMPLAVKEWAGHDSDARPSSLGEERWPWVLCSFLLVFPLSFARRLTALKYTAGLSVGIVLCLAVVALLYAGGVWPPCDAVEGNEETAAAAASCIGTYAPGAKGGVAALKVLPIFIFSYTCHQNFPLLLNELASPTDARVRTTVGAAAGLSLGTYLLIAEAAYWTYGSMTGQDLLQTFPASRLVTWLRALVSLLVTFTFPLQAHPARTCILNLWDSLSSRQAAAAAAPTPASSPDTPSGHHHAPISSVDRPNDDAKPDNDQEHDRLAGLRYTFVTLTFLCTALLVALLVHDLSLVLELVGATGSTIVSYLLPGAAYVRLHPYPHARRTAAQLQFVVGVGVMAVGLTAVFLKA